MKCALCGSDSSTWERITSTLARCGCGAVVALIQSKRKRPVWSVPSERSELHCRLDNCVPMVQN